MPHQPGDSTTRNLEQRRRDAVRVAVYLWLLDGGGSDEEDEFHGDSSETAGDVRAEQAETRATADGPEPPAFLSLFRHGDPAPAVFEALSFRRDRLLPISAAVCRDDVFYDAAGVRGAQLFINTIEWIDEHTAETTAGVHAGPLAAYMSRLRVHERDGGWIVEDLGILWIS